jgi:hypothetical protein
VLAQTPELFVASSSPLFDWSELRGWVTLALLMLTAAGAWFAAMKGRDSARAAVDLAELSRAQFEPQLVSSRGASEHVYRIVNSGAVPLREAEVELALSAPNDPDLGTGAEKVRLGAWLPGDEREIVAGDFGLAPWGVESKQVVRASLTIGTLDLSADLLVARDQLPQTFEARVIATGVWGPDSDKVSAQIVWEKTLSP